MLTRRGVQRCVHQPAIDGLATNLLRDPVRITVEAFEGHQPDMQQAWTCRR